MYDWQDRPKEGFDIQALEAQKPGSPGSVFKYNDVRINVLSYALMKLFQDSLAQVLKEKIMDKIGASQTWYWEGYHNTYLRLGHKRVQSVSGGGHFGGGLFISSLDQAKFGLLISRKGKWKNKQLISEGWIEDMQKPSKVHDQHGLLWWLPSKNNLIQDKYFMAAGFGGNYIIIVPEKELVIVVRWLDPKQLQLFLNKVLQSFK